MKKNKRPVHLTGQHFTIDKSLIADAIRIAQLNPNDTVLDIGAGKGSFTQPLAKRCKSVLAIENDTALLKILRKEFHKNHNITIVASDFRRYILPKKKFKVVSNIPYRITADIFKKLLYTNLEYCMGGVLILQLQPAQTLVSEKLFNPRKVFYRTFFDLQLQYKVSPSSFSPSPTVMSALLQIKRKEVKIPIALKNTYLNFLFYLLQKPELSAKKALNTVFRKSQIRDMAAMYSLPLNSKIVTLSVEQWCSCFLYMLDNIPERFYPVW